MSDVINPERLSDSIVALIDRREIKRVADLGVGRPSEEMRAVKQARPDIDVTALSSREPQFGSYDMVWIPGPLDARIGTIIDAAIELLPPGGILAGAGYCRPYYEAMRAIAARFCLMNVGLTPTGMWFVIRPAVQQEKSDAETTQG